MKRGRLPRRGFSAVNAKLMSPCDQHAQPTQIPPWLEITATECSGTRSRGHEYRPIWISIGCISIHAPVSVLVRTTYFTTCSQLLLPVDLFNTFYCLESKTNVSEVMQLTEKAWLFSNEMQKYYFCSIFKRNKCRPPPPWVLRAGMSLYKALLFSNVNSTLQAALKLRKTMLLCWKE